MSDENAQNDEAAVEQAEQPAPEAPTPDPVPDAAPTDATTAEAAPEPDPVPDAAPAEAGRAATTAPASSAPAPAPRIRELYEQDVRPKLQDEFGYSSPMEHPRITKITLNMGVGEAKQNSKSLDDAVEQLAEIAGQKPVITRARKSIAQFKLREGMAIGAKVTLRGARMWEFYDRLTAVALPRIRDFRGVNPDSFDGRGNYALGIREQTIFPEIDYDGIDKIRGLDVIITTSAGTDEEGRALLRHLGMPFREQGYTAEERAARRRRKQRSRSRSRSKKR